jgi:hypothetical protein
MKELLERWAKAEPKRCWPMERGYERLGTHWVDPGPGAMGLALNGEKPLPTAERALLQAAVQEAIEAREWDWDLCFNHQQDSPRYCAIIGDLYNGSTPGEWGSTPAEALLSAYLTALEAQA